MILSKDQDHDRKRSSRKRYVISIISVLDLQTDHMGNQFAVCINKLRSPLLESRSQRLEGQIVLNARLRT